MSKKKKDEAVENTEEVKTAGEAAQEQPEEKDEKEEQIQALQQEVAAGKDKYMRLAAEYDNYRKRTANEKLSLYDEILKGIGLISNQLDKSFEKLKIEAYGKVGEDFDPNLHNAIGMVDNEELGSGKLAAVFQTGYKIGDKIIRHAMVQVTN